MTILMNLVWILLGGWLVAAAWAAIGLLWSVTIVGLPVGTQCFKFAVMSLVPFGREVFFGGGAGSLLLNVLWLAFGGIELAGLHLMIGAALCLTIVGIPFGLQHFKLARLAILPFGSKVM